MVKSLLYSPEVLGGLSILTQGLAGKSPEVVVPSLMQGVQTASAMTKYEDEEDKKKFIEQYKDQVPKAEMELFLYDPELYIKNRVYTKAVKADFQNFSDTNSGQVRMFNTNTKEGLAALKIFENEVVNGKKRNVIETPSMDKSSDLDIEKSNKKDVQKKVIDAYEQKDNIENMKLLFQPEFSTYLGKSKALVASELQKLGIKTPKEITDFLNLRSEWEMSVNAFFDTYRKYVTGVAASPQELKIIEKSVPNKNDAPSVFLAKIKLQEIKNQQIIDRNNAFMELGVGEITRNKDNEPTGKYKEFLEKNKLSVTKEEAVSLVTDLSEAGYTDQAIGLKIRQIFGKENEDKVLTMLGLK